MVADCLRRCSLHKVSDILPQAGFCCMGGTKIHPGTNVGKGKDDTLFALKNGTVKFERLGKDRKKVSIVEIPQ